MAIIVLLKIKVLFTHLNIIFIEFMPKFIIL